MCPDKSNVRTWLSGEQVHFFIVGPNLKLGLLKSRRDSWQCGTSHADTDDDDVSLAGVLQDAVCCGTCAFTVFGR